MPAGSPQLDTPGATWTYIQQTLAFYISNPDYRCSHEFVYFLLAAKGPLRHKQARIASEFYDYITETQIAGKIWCNSYAAMYHF